MVEPPDGQSFSVVLLAPSRQEKAAWTSDISQVGEGEGQGSEVRGQCPALQSESRSSALFQCIDNIRCNGLMTSVFEENSKVSVPHMIK